jgi:hypothetical protein
LHYGPRNQEVCAGGGLSQSVDPYQRQARTRSKQVWRWHWRWLRHEHEREQRLLVFQDAQRWRHYDPTQEPLGRLSVIASWNSRKDEETSTKTERPRAVPVHPTLAKLLADWKLSGRRQLFGRAPKADDLILPNRDGEHRNPRRSIVRFHYDLEKLGLRKRRQHDCRRTFISLAQADGARKDILRWVTHGPTGDIMDIYTTLPWDALCAEVSKLRVEIREGRVLELRQVIGDLCDRSCERSSGDTKKPPRFHRLGGFFDCEGHPHLPLTGIKVAQKPSDIICRTWHVLYSWREFRGLRRPC